MVPDLEAETKRMGYTWGRLERLAQDRDNNNDNNERISRALFHVKHAQLR